MLKKIFRKFLRLILLYSPEKFSCLFIRLPFSRFHRVHDILLRMVEGEEIIQLYNAKFKLNPGNFFDYFVYFFPITSNVEINTLIPYVRKSKCFVDIGANSGLFTFILTGINKNIKTYAFEPNPEILKKLNINLELNPDISNQLNIINNAVSDKSESVEFAISKKDIQSARIVKEYDGEKVIVNSITLDEFFEKKEISPDLIKMDAEGEELKILKGMKDLFKNNPPQTMLIEVHAGYYPEDEAKVFKQSIFDILISNKYKLSALKENKLEEIEDPDQWPGRYHILAIRENQL